MAQHRKTTPARRALLARINGLDAEQMDEIFDDLLPRDPGFKGHAMNVIRKQFRKYFKVDASMAEAMLNDHKALRYRAAAQADTEALINHAGGTPRLPLVKKEASSSVTRSRQGLPMDGFAPLLFDLVIDLGKSPDHQTARRRMLKQLEEFHHRLGIIRPEVHASRRRIEEPERQRIAARDTAQDQEDQRKQEERLRKEAAAKDANAQARIRAEVQKQHDVQTAKATHWAGVNQRIAEAGRVTSSVVSLLLSRPEFLDLDGKTPTVTRVLAVLKVPKDQAKVVKAELETERQARLAENAVQKARAAEDRATQKQKRDAERAWNDALIHAADLPAHLGITRTEYLRWREEKKIPISRTKAFRKWGQTLEAALHHPDDLVAVTPEAIAQWRADHQSLTARNRQAGAQKAALSRALPPALTRLAGMGFTRSTPTSTVWRWDVEMTLAVGPHVASCLFATTGVMPLPTSLDGLAQLPSRLQALAASFNIARAQAQVQERVVQALAAHGMGPAASPVSPPAPSAPSAPPVPAILTAIDEPMAPLPPTPNTPRPSDPRELQAAKWAALWATLQRGTLWFEVTTAQLINVLKGVDDRAVRRAFLDHAHQNFRLDQYPESFPLARTMNRRLRLVLGDTNAGKTYEALQALQKAESGVYLAPLRLLAMEVFDRLTAAGIPCDLRTGEEHIVVPGARHVCATVEMMDPYTEVEVAVVDECQMLLDEHRGSAWTAALVGVPARQVFMVSAPVTESLITRLAERLGEPMTVSRLHRKTPLSVMSSTVSLDAVEPGDAVIAFSRREVLQIASRLQDHGHPVSTLYGALAPEVRRIQAELFTSGQTSVVVATDAIGMGMNLPIRRVLFHAVRKFDGHEMRELNAMECRQIGGRAGRFGLHERGYVGAQSAEALRLLHERFQEVPRTYQTQMGIAPSLTYVQQIGQRLNETRLLRVLQEFWNLPFQHELFVRTVPESLWDWAEVVDRHGKALSLETRFAYACVPLSARRDHEVAWVLDALRHHVSKSPMKLVPLPDWAQRSTPGHQVRLEEAEALARQLGLYAWLATRFPLVFPDGAHVPAQRRVLSAYITECLAPQRALPAGKSGKPGRLPLP